MIVPALILLISVGNYIVSWAHFKIKFKRSSGIPPSVPYSLPFVAHTASFAAGSEKLAQILRTNALPGAAVRFKGIGFNFVLISGADFIRKALAGASHFDWNKISAPLFGGMFGGPDRIIEALRQDDSGIGVKPYPGSNVIFFSDAFSRASLDEIVPRFINNLHNWGSSSSKTISSEWVEFPDLYQFTREILFACGVEAIFGKSILKLNPDLANDFWEYDDNIDFLATPMPTWMRPNAVRARSRCLEAMKKWRANAIRNTDPTVADDAAWDPAWGLGAIRRRNKLLDATEGLFDQDGRASIDLALLWSLTSNVIPASFWYMAEVLASKGLLDRVRNEIATELGSSYASQIPEYDPVKLTNNSLMQAIYAESLRLHVVTLITRTVKEEHSVGSWLLQKDQNIIVSSQVEHLHEQWSSLDGEHTPDEFWPDRFLVQDVKSPEHGTKFSLDGRQGQWIPFGLGEHMCPGRHFAKQEMILNCAVLLTMFDIELLKPSGWRPTNDLRRYGFGSQQPKEKTPFRIKRRSH